MAELRVLRSSLTRTGVTRYIKFEAFVRHGFCKRGWSWKINTFPQLLLTFKSICSGRLIQIGNIPFSITASASIEDLWLWINNRRKRNQYRSGGNFNQYQRDEFHEIYRDVQERSEAKHDNEWILPKWESKTEFPEWDDFMLNVMENEKFYSDKKTPIHCLLCKEEEPNATADIPTGIDCI